MEATTRGRSSRLRRGLLALAGVALVIAGAAAAIVEGYASDAEVRSGNILPAAAIVVAGLVVATIGVVLFLRTASNERSTQAGDSTE